MQEHKPILIEDDPNLPRPVSKKSKIAAKIVFFALFLIAAIIGLVAYWTVQPADPLQINNSPFPVRTIRQEPTPDGVLVLTVDYCKTMNVSGKVRMSFVSSSSEIFLPVSEEHLPLGCRKNVEVPVVIPKDLTPDTYKIKFRTTYNINPIKSEVVREFESRPFTVAGPGAPGTTILTPQPPIK